MRDQTLLLRYADSGDATAFEALVEKHLGFIAAVAHRRCGDRQLAEEAVQNTFALLARKAGKLTSHPTVGGWLHRTVMYEAGRLKRSENNRKKKMRALAEEMDLGSEKAPTVDHEAIDLCLEKLRPAERDVLVLRFFEGLSFREIGELLGKTESAARKQGERALGKMRKRLGAGAAGLQAHFSIGAPAVFRSAGEVAGSSIAASSSISGQALFTNTLLTMSYPNLTAACAVIILFALPIGYELKENIRLRASLAEPLLISENAESLPHKKSPPSLTPETRELAKRLA